MVERIRDRKISLDDLNQLRLWCYLFGKPLLEKREKGRTPIFFSAGA
jgi:hypothetical protein